MFFRVCLYLEVSHSKLTVPALLHCISLYLTVYDSVFSYIFVSIRVLWYAACIRVLWYAVYIRVLWYALSIRVLWYAVCILVLWYLSLFDIFWRLSILFRIFCFPCMLKYAFVSASIRLYPPASACIRRCPPVSACICPNEPESASITWVVNLPVQEAQGGDPGLVMRSR